MAACEEAVTDTKAKRTFSEVVLGDDPVRGKKKEQDLLEKQKLKDSRTTVLLKRDVEKATKLQSNAMSNIARIEAKVSERKKRLIELERDIKKAELVLKERLDSLDGERVVLSKMRAELLQNTDMSAIMRTDASIDEPERKELELPRKLASACIQNEIGEAENEVKRLVMRTT